MPRSHARISLRIWSDADWLDLPMHAQWLYLALVSQEGINHAGILSLTRRRWAKLCADRDADTVDDAVKVLTDRRFIVVDEDTEQVLVRTFVRNDEVWRQPNTLKNACASIRLVTSPVLRAALLSELLRLDMAKIEKLRAAEGHERAHEVLRATIAALAGDHPRSPDPTRSTPSDGYVCDPYADPIPATPSNPLPRRRAGEGDGEGVVVAPPDSLSGRTPEGTRTRTRTPRRIAELASSAHSVAAHRLVEAYAATCVRRPPLDVLGQLGVQVDALLAEHWPPDDIARALAAWGTKALGPRSLPSVAHEVVNRRVVPRPAPRPVRSTTDDRVAAAQSLKTQLRALPGGA